VSTFCLIPGTKKPTKENWVFMPYSGVWSSIRNWGIMQFKPSAGVFVGGLATMVGSAFIFAIAMASSEGAFMGLIGFAGGVAGLIMLCVGAARALAIIDALPAAFRNVSVLQAPLHQAPAPQQSNQAFPESYGHNQPPVQ
jgi:hypothetical protein